MPARFKAQEYMTSYHADTATIEGDVELPAK